MEKINVKELGLPVKSQEYRPFDHKWIDEVIKLLIEQRVKHCKAELDNAKNRDEAYICNHSNSQYIIYVDENGKEYGHFGVPTYNHMVDFLEGGMPYDKGIIQQALRQHFHNIKTREFMDCCENVIKILKSYNKLIADLENVLTEMMLIL